jgi:glycerate dehydrogenase
VQNGSVTLEKGVFLDLETVDRGDLDRTGLDACLPEWDWHPFTEPADIPERVRGAQVVVTNKCRLDGAALAGASELRLVAVASTGTDIVDPEAARHAGVTVCNIRDYCTGAVAQHTVTLMLNLERPIREAAGLKVGVIGYGTLGRAAAAAAGALGMKVLVAERKGRRARPGRLPFEDVVRRADVLSIHCPLTDETRNLVARGELVSMKSDAILINTARGGIVNERDLADALRAGDIGGAGVDTLTSEPPPPDHPLLAADIPNLLLTPHNAWASKRGRQAALDQLTRIVQAFAAGQPFNVVI